MFPDSCVTYVPDRTKSTFVRGCDRRWRAKVACEETVITRRSRE